MNGFINASEFSLDAIIQAINILNLTYFTSNTAIKSTDSSVITHFQTYFGAVHECLNLKDLTDGSINRFTAREIEEISGYNLTDIKWILHWCNFGKTTWFHTIISTAYEQSWEKRISSSLEFYYLPFSYILSILIILMTLPVLHDMQKDRDESVHSRGRYSSHRPVHVSASWTLLFHISLFGLLWMLVDFVHFMLRSILLSHLSSLITNVLCSLTTYTKNVLQCIPTWLTTVLICDRTSAEYRAGRMPPVQDMHYRPRPIKVPSCERADKHQVRRLSKPRRGDEATTSQQDVGTSPHERRVRDDTSNLISYHGNQETVAPIGAGRLEGIVLVCAVVSILGLLNTHLLWLYKVSKSSGKCLLTTSSGVLLAYVYPLALRVIRLVLPNIFTLVCLSILLVVARWRSQWAPIKPFRQTRNFISPPLTRRCSPSDALERYTIPSRTSLSVTPASRSFCECFFQPTQVAIAVAVVSLMFELPELIDWLWTEFGPSAHDYLVLEKSSNDSASTLEQFYSQIEAVGGINSSSQLNMTVTMIRLKSSDRLLTALIKMRFSVFVTMIKRIWVIHRFLILAPLLFFQSVVFRSKCVKFYRGWLLGRIKNWLRRVISTENKNRNTCLACKCFRYCNPTSMRTTNGGRELTIQQNSV